MIILICGPSGSGKTTAIKYISERLLCSIIPVDVISKGRVYDFGFGRKQVSEDVFCANESNNCYTHIYCYGEQKYGVNLNNLEDNQFYVFDYPGEYPNCSELDSYQWTGILVLPPSEQELINRLINLGRNNRIHSAVKEYNECLEELSCNKYSDWFVISTKSIRSMHKAIDNIVSQLIHFN